MHMNKFITEKSENKIDSICTVVSTWAQFLKNVKYYRLPNFKIKLARY